MNQTQKLHKTQQSDHFRFVASLLRSRRKAEALNWLSGSSPSQRRSLGKFRGAKPSVKLVEKLNSLGARKVIAVDIKTQPTGSQRTEKLILELPTETPARTAIFRWCKRQGGKVGYSPEQDGGETHLYLLLA
jgi:hypothetical protein